MKPLLKGMPWEKTGKEAWVQRVVAGERVSIQGEEVEIKLPCDLSSQGRWYCVTCQEGFTNQLMKDIHVGRKGKHRLVWLCFHHGAEQP